MDTMEQRTGAAFTEEMHFRRWGFDLGSIVRVKEASNSIHRGQCGWVHNFTRQRIGVAFLTRPNRRNKVDVAHFSPNSHSLTLVSDNDKEGLKIKQSEEYEEWNKPLRCAAVLEQADRCVQQSARREAEKQRSEERIAALEVEVKELTRLVDELRLELQQQNTPHRRRT